MANEREIIKEALDKFTSRMKNKQLQGERSQIVAEVSKEVIKIFAPVFKQMAEQSRLSKDDLKMIASEIAAKINIPEINVPELVMPPMPKVEVPTPRVNVEAPKIDILDIVRRIEMPDEMSITGWIGLQGYDVGLLNNPLPVQLRDAKGNPVNMAESITQIIGGGGGGGPRNIKVTDILASASSVIDQVEGAVKVTGDLSATLTADTGSGEIGSDTLRIVQATDAVASVNIVSGSASGTEYTEGDTVGPGDGGLIMVRDAAGSVYGARVGGGTSETAIRVVHATDVGLSVAGTVDLGSTDNAVLDSIDTNTGNAVFALQILDDWDESDRAKVNIIASQAGVAANQGATDGRTLRVVHAGDAGVTVEASQLDIDDLDPSSDGVRAYQVSGANWSVEVSNSITSVIAVGDIASDEADTGSAPVKVGGIARTANPTAVAAGDRVAATYDDVGRQVVRPLQVRDLMQTAYVELSDGGEDSLLAGASSTFHDLVYVMGANESDAAVNIDLRSETAGGVMQSLSIPANSTAGVSLSAPLPQNTAAGTWTAQNSGSDISNTTVKISALFIKEV